MLRSTLAFSPPSTPFLKPSNKSVFPRIFPTSSSSSVHPVGLSLRTSNIFSFTRFHSPFYSSSACLNQRFHSLKVRAASVPDSIEETSKSSAIHAFQLGGLFGLWYILNIYFNIFNKQRKQLPQLSTTSFGWVLKIYPYPTTITAFEFGCGTLMIIFMWTFNLYSRPKLTRSQLAAIIPLAVAHTLGNLLTNVSLGKVNVSFTHTIKAMEPFFTVLFASLFLGEKPAFGVVSSLLPIVGGVALASSTEASFNWTGFFTAMASNVTNQSRNVLSKNFMIRTEDTLDNINLFSVITIFCFILLVPAAIVLEGTKFTPSYLQFAASQGLNVKELCIKSLLAGFCFHSYQQVSYFILQLVSPITHSVGNCVKRVVVIVSSVIFFQTPVSPINSIGTAVALAGVFLYSRAKRMKPKPKTA